MLTCDTAVKCAHRLICAARLHLKEKRLGPSALWAHRLGLVSQRPRVLTAENVIDDLAGEA